MDKRLIRLPEVAARLGHRRTTVYNRIRDGLLPQPIALGPRLVAWLSTEVDAIIAAYTRGASEDEIRSLVKELVAARKEAA